MKYVGIIPARYASTRFPGKPLADVGGTSMILGVCRQAAQSTGDLFVATDDDRIRENVESGGYKVIMTSSGHTSGTDRCAEAISTIEESSGIRYDVVINIQGDEPFIKPEQIDLIKTCFNEPGTGIATLVRAARDEGEITNPNQPKVVLDNNMNALYFSRNTIPYLRGTDRDKWHLQHQYLIHVGMYAYRREILSEITALAPTRLEKAESLEQLRWLENGFKIKAAVTEHISHAIDTPEDLDKIRSMFLK